MACNRPDWHKVSEVMRRLVQQAGSDTDKLRLYRYAGDLHASPGGGRGGWLVQQLCHSVACMHALSSPRQASCSSGQGGTQMGSGCKGKSAQTFVTVHCVEKGMQQS